MKQRLNNAMPKLIHMLQAVSEYSGRLVAWLTLGIVLTMFGIVVMRYFFNSGSIALQESVAYMYAMVFLIGIAYTLKHDEHVRVDIFYQRFSRRTRAIIDIFGHLLLLFPTVILILYLSWDYVQASWAMREESGDAGGLAYVYLLKSGIIVMGGLLILESCAQIILNLDHIFHPSRESAAHDNTTVI